MKKFLIEFMVQVEDDNAEWIEGMAQAERYLNTGGRCVDFNMRVLTPAEVAENKSLIMPHNTLPTPAEILPED